MKAGESRKEILPDSAGGASKGSRRRSELQIQCREASGAQSDSLIESDPSDTPNQNLRLGRINLIHPIWETGWARSIGYAPSGSPIGQDQSATFNPRARLGIGTPPEEMTILNFKFNIRMALEFVSVERAEGPACDSLG